MNGYRALPASPAGIRKDTKYPNQTLNFVLPGLKSLRDRKGVAKLCSCFYPPSLKEVVEPYLARRIDSLSFEELTGLYSRLQRVSEGSLTTNLRKVIVIELNWAFSKNENQIDLTRIERFIYKGCLTHAQKQRALNTWLSYSEQGNIARLLVSNLNHGLQAAA